MVRKACLQWIDRYIQNPGLTQKEFLSKRALFLWVIVTCSAVIGLTALAFSLKVTIIGLYGLALLLGYYPLSFYGFRAGHDYDLFTFIGNIGVIVTTCVFVLLFGGFLNSGGIIFSWWNVAYTAIYVKSAKKVIWLFASIGASILVVAFANPYLTPHPQVTPRINLIFWIINMIWMSVMQIYFIVTYVGERGRLETAETERIRAIDQARTRLYTNITHEFRTPLTLILGMADQLSPSDENGEKAKSVITRQGSKLLRMVNQMLDLSKLEAGAVKAKFIQSDAIRFLRLEAEAFRTTAEISDIGLFFSSNVHECIMDFDPEKLEHVVNNLLHNAIKFTESGGQVRVSVRILTMDHDTRVLEVSIADTGIGIPEDKLPHIFDRFYQVEEQAMTHEGTGIGLTMVREYVKLMGGEIIADRLEPGMRFRLTLPITNDAPLREAAPIESESKREGMESFEPSERHREEIVDKPSILVVEDNVDVKEYLVSLLAGDYHVLTAEHGKAGLNRAFESMPDIIISDVMMPVMDGFAFLQALKSDLRTSHIPVILLTARADAESKLEGLEHGAEAYLTKPFMKEELRIRLSNILAQRKALQEHYGSFEADLDMEASAPVHDFFIGQVRETLKEHLDDEEFGIAELCRALSMSRSQLYRKFTALTNTTVSKYMRSYRLQRAMELLKKSDLNVSQVMLEVGFTNLSYFSRCFKEKFSVSPSKVRRENRMPGQ